MKKKHIYKYSMVLVLLAAGLFSCKKSAPTLTSNFLDYTIPYTPATKNYTVGAFYYAPSVFNANITQQPTVGGPGSYFYSKGFPSLGTPALPILTPAIMDAHVADAATAGIDYFIFSLRSPTLDNANFQIDSNTVVSFLNAANSSKMNFAVSYNLNTGLLGVSNTKAIDSSVNATKLTAFYNDFKRLSYWMTKANYQKVNGKYLIIINHAQDLNAKSCPALYTQLRTNLSALGFSLYIVGMQSNWQPPQRYYYRFQNCTDAMYEANMGDVAGDNDRYWEFPQFVDQNWAYYKTTVESWGQEFVPCVMAGYNYQITNPTSTGLSVQRTNDGAWYNKFTDVAKRNASKSGLIFLDSFNNFSLDSQVEPTAAYGNNFLNITKTAFKIN